MTGPEAVQKIRHWLNHNGLRPTFLKIKPLQPCEKPPILGNVDLIATSLGYRIEALEYVPLRKPDC